MRKIACEPGMEVAGASLLSFINSLMADELAPLVKKYGFQNIAADKWYSMQDYLDFLYELTQQPNLVSNLVSIGMSIAEYGHMPPGMEHPTFEQIVESWDEHYQANYRNGDAGHKHATKVGPNHYKIVLDKTVVPDNLEYGVLYGFAKRFLPPGTYFTVWFDEDVLRMDEGGEQTVLNVEWE